MTPVAFTLAPAAMALIGAGVTAWRRPGPLAVSGIQHFAAGVVFAAAAGEILPDLKHAGAALPVLIGGAVGVLAMMGIEYLETRAKGSVGLMVAVGVDLFIDGLVLGLAFVAGQTQGLLLTIALTLEVLFLGLTVSLAIGGGWRRAVGTTALLTLLLPAGALAAAPLGQLPAPMLTAFLAFGLVALLYLVTEELLVEAHEVPDRPWTAALFFAGFLLLLLLADLMEPAGRLAPA
ncbi:MAG: transporter [Phenylobacterium sp.]|uniref:transporter n=1 Tax=Phenylobacterium sp. TaxID=1871053 RepID=UPI001A645781|nr:transporter [Phenylobacterium sp.]MBL8772225.1 transporter [Phenylobacterium sp.]